jgi:hypothetical protein
VEYQNNDYRNSDIYRNNNAIAADHLAFYYIDVVEITIFDRNNDKIAATKWHRYFGI